MPTYEYLCTSCKDTHEVFQRITEEPLKRCDKCQQDTLEKVLGVSAFQLKGADWPSRDLRPVN